MGVKEKIVKTLLVLPTATLGTLALGGAAIDVSEKKNVTNESIIALFVGAYCVGNAVYIIKS
jgi:hypothetical protein